MKDVLVAIGSTASMRWKVLLYEEPGGVLNTIDVEQWVAGKPFKQRLLLTTYLLDEGPFMISHEISLCTCITVRAMELLKRILLMHFLVRNNYCESYIFRQSKLVFSSIYSAGFIF